MAQTEDDVKQKRGVKKKTACCIHTNSKAVFFSVSSSKEYFSKCSVFSDLKGCLRVEERPTCVEKAKF